MKRYFPLLFLGLFLTGCDIFSPSIKFTKPEKDLAKLPTETQEGKNTIGCLLNGQVWQNHGGGWFNPDYKASYFKKNISVGGSMNTEQDYQSLTLQLNNVFKGIGNYKLGNDSTTRVVCINSKTNCNYDEGTFTMGNLEITKFDTIKHIVCGRFNFTLIKVDCDTIRATDGRFDIKYGY
jgi:hypothetical protein